MASSILGPGMMSAQSSLQEARESQVLQQVQTATGPDRKEKIEKGAKEFEAMLLSGWLQQAEQSLATVPGADEDEDAAGKGTMMSMGVQALSEAMAANGGIGIAAMITKGMLAMAQKTTPAGGQSQGSGFGAEVPTKNEQSPLNSVVKNADRMAVSRKGSE